MTLHTPTIVVLSLLTDLLLVLILLHAWRTRTTYPGFMHWVVGTACWTVGSFLNMLLADLQPTFIPRIIGIALILLHPVLLYEGLVRFYGIKRRLIGTPLNSALMALQLMLSFYWNYVAANYALRSATFSLLFAFLFGRIAVEPLLQRDIRRYSMQWLMSITLLPLVALTLMRAAWHIGDAGAITNMSTALTGESLLRWILLYGFVVELMFCYSYLALTSDRVERELQEARESAEAASKAKGSFLKMISHELRTPLATITGITELMVRRGDACDELPRMLQRAAQHQQRLINDLLDSAAIRTGKVAIKPHPFNLKRLLDEFRDIYLPRAKARGIDYQGIRSSDLPNMIVGDRQRIFQVCANLYENALKYTPAGGSVIARAELLNNRTLPQLCFSAQDTGCGIPFDKQEEIFAPFVSLNPDNAGLGLGLAICRQLAEAMGGQITCKSIAGQGSTFSFSLPCTLPSPEQQVISTETELTATQRQPLKILAIDDTPENLQLLELMLQDTPVRITPAGSARQALELLEQRSFDLVLTDIRMPDMDGVEMVHAIRSSEQRQGRQPMRIVAVSANAYPEDISIALEAGCDSYLSRPFSLQQLVYELAIVLPDTCAATTAQEEPLQQLRQQALQRIADLLMVLETALDEGDAALIREEGHRIKGLGMTFGLPEAERIGGLLEHAGREGRLEGVAELLEGLRP